MKRRIPPSITMRENVMPIHEEVQKELIRRSMLKPLLTANQIKHIVPSLSDTRALQLAALHEKICPRYQINTPERLSMFIANCAHESQEYKRKEENLSYSAQRLLVVFPSRFTNLVTAKQYEYRPEKLANYVYGGRNGNKESGDGYAFRGSGFIQCTFRNLIEAYAKHLGYPLDKIAALAHEMRTDDERALDSACWLFAVEKKLLDEADKGEVERARKLIAGSLFGFEDVKKYYQRAKEVL